MVQNQLELTSFKAMHTLLVLIDFYPVQSELGVLFTKTFDILPETIIEYQIQA